MLSNILNKLLAFFILPLIFTSGYSQITVDKTAGCAPLTVSFKPPVGMTTYYWDFDNGGSSEDSTPNVVFTTPKNPYKVSLRACKTCPILHTIDIQAHPKPTVTVPSSKGCPPLNVSFNPNISLPPGVSITSLKYIFGDGNSQTKTPPNLFPASNTYNDPDKTYTVSFELKTSPTSAGCDHTVVIPNTVETSSITFNWLQASPSAGCTPPLNVNFTHSIQAKKAIVSYEWDFGDGNTSTAMLPSHTYTQTGNFMVRLTVKDANGCEKTHTTNVIVRNNDMTKIISLDTICVHKNLTLNIDGNAGLSAQWLLGSGNIAFSRPVNDYYTTPGLKTITVTSFYLGNICPKTLTKKVMVLDPQIEYTLAPKPLCNRQNTFTLTCTNSQLFSDIQWSLHLIRQPGDTAFVRMLGTNFTQTVTHTIDLDTIPWRYHKFLLRAVATTKHGGCIIKMQDLFDMDPLIAHVAPTLTSGCKPLRVGFYDRTLLYRMDTLKEWKLIFGDGNEVTRNSFSDTFYHTYTNRGVYDMRMVVKNKYNCIDTTYVTKIEVGDTLTPDFTITTSGSLCASDPNTTVTLQSTVSPNLVQQTKFWADGHRCVQWNNMTFKPNNRAGTYPIKMEVADRGCFSSTTKTITIKGPVSEFVQNQNCDSPRKVEFINKSQEANSYLWQFGDGSTSTDTNPKHTYVKDSIYNVRLIAYHASNGCPADTYSLPVQIQTPLAKFDKDTYFFCHTDISQMIRARNSKGYIRDNQNTGFIWEFEQGRGPTRTFRDSLDYDVHTRIQDLAFVSVRNFMNCVSSDTAVIFVDELKLNYTIKPDTICNGDTVKYNGIMTSLLPISMQRWKFGDGDSANKLDTFHLYHFSMKTALFYENTFNAETVKGCKLQTTKTLIVKKLNLTLEPYSANLCLQSSTVPVNISAKVDSAYPSAFRWQKPDNTIQYGKTINYIFSNTGSYNFHIIATDSSNANCIDTLSPATVVVHKKPNLGLTSDKDTFRVLCDPVNIDIGYIDSNTTPIITRKWLIIDSTGSTNYNNNLTVSRSLHKGMNKVQLIANTAYCQDTVVKDYIVRAPSGSMTIDKNDICKGDEITFTVHNLIDVSDYSVDLGDGTVISNIPIIKHKYAYVPLGGKTVAKGIFLASGYECVGKPFDTTIRIHEVFAKFSIDGPADTPICFRAVLIKDSSIGADKYFWNFGDGSTGTMREPGLKTYPNSQKYQVQLAIENLTYGCKDTFKDSVELVALPNSSPTNDTVCLGDTAKVYQQISQKNVKYIWTPTGIHLNNRSDTIFYKRDSSIQYRSIAIDTTTKCIKEAQGLITVIQPMVKQKLDTIIAPGADVLLPFTPAANYGYTWVPDSFLSCLDCPDPTAQYLLKPITYKVIFYDKIKNCFRDSSIYKINIFPDILVSAPTAFSPNGDGNNDVFYAKGFGIKKLTAFKIYNRQGTLIFHSISEKDGWDGNYKGEPQNSDTYFYTIEGESYIPNKRVFKEGNFMLLR
jgi:gliding motility-associated-like protein